jgi:SAM-dependent methyltransferase
MTGKQKLKWADIDRLREDAEGAASTFLATYEADVEAYRKQISDGIDEALKEIREDIDEISGGNPICIQIADQATEYVSWMQWALWDLPFFAVAIRPSFESFRDSVAACGLVYIAIRVFDDVIDRHFSYKGRQQTLFGSATQAYTGQKTPEGLAILAGLLLCYEGLTRLAVSQNSLATMNSLVSSIRRAVIGAMMEYTDTGEWTQQFYDVMVQLKNVYYWRGLYSALDPEHHSPLYPFLEKYYDLAQNLNDVQDYDEDMRVGQPNLVAIHLMQNRDSATSSQATMRSPGMAPDSVEELIAEKFLALEKLALDLPDLERSIAQLKLAESLREARRLQLFVVPAEVEEIAELPPHSPHLYWYSEIQNVIEEFGSAGLENVNCPVCDSDEPKTLFRKQGFSFNRCQICTHIYVTPRITSSVQAQLLRELDEQIFEDRYLEVQRIYAESTCHLLQMRSSGARLLDIGFGRGYLMQLAQAYGFEVYGLDGSTSQIERLHPLFGHRVTECVLGRDDIPWDAFDVVVMSHILEHLHDPKAILCDIFNRLNPGGLLYIAVPDIDSITFKVFGKRWDVINPLVHLQYFNESSLIRLLEQCNFTDIERIKHPTLRDEYSPRWMRLMRHLGGTDTNELAILAKSPQEG